MFLNNELYDQLWTSLQSSPAPTMQSAIEALRPKILPQFENLHSHTY